MTPPVELDRERSRAGRDTSSNPSGDNGSPWDTGRDGSPAEPVPPPSPSPGNEGDAPPEEPQTALSLEKFCNLVEEIAGNQDPQAQLRAAELALKGTQDGLSYSITPTARERLTDDELERVRTSYDIDSMKGVITENDQWPFEEAIEVYPVSPWPEVITGHSRYRIKIGKEVGSQMASVTMQRLIWSVQLVPVHHFKNTGFCRIGENIRIRAVFPALRQTNAGPKDPNLSTYQIEAWYDDVMRPAIQAIAPDVLPHWPINANHCMFIARRERGQLVFTGVDVQATLVWLFISRMRTILNAPTAPATIQAFRGFMLYWEVQGIKLQGRFTQAAGEDFHNQFERCCVVPAFTGINQARLNPDTTHVDVAMEKGLPGYSLYFATESHEMLLEHCCKETQVRANNMVQSTTHGASYLRNYVATLQHLSGFRVSYLARVEPRPILYLQAYHTDKNITYQSSSFTHTIPLRPTSLLEAPKSSSGGFTSFFRGINQTFTDAQENVGGESRIRLEVTVTLAKMRRHGDLNLILNLSSDTLAACVFKYPRETMP